MLGWFIRIDMGAPEEIGLPSGVISACPPERILTVTAWDLS
jgi:hypothetical protein